MFGDMYGLEPAFTVSTSENLMAAVAALHIRKEIKVYITSSNPEDCSDLEASSIRSHSSRIGNLLLIGLS